MLNPVVSREEWKARLELLDLVPKGRDDSAADWLSLAAAPTFAIMAMLTSVLPGGPLDTSARARKTRRH